MVEWYWQEKSKVLGEEASGNSTSSTTNVTAGPNPGLSGQRPVTVLSHACSLKTEVNANCIWRSSPYRPVNTQLWIPDTWYCILIFPTMLRFGKYTWLVFCLFFKFLSFLYFDRLWRLHTSKQWLAYIVWEAMQWCPSVSNDIISALREATFGR
jgi:hypothetical protein